MKQQAAPYPQRRITPFNFYPPLSAEHDTDIGEVNRIFHRTLPSDDPVSTLIYIHIPFCQSICHFCGFYRKNPDMIQGWSAPDVYRAFSDKLLQEIRLWAGLPAARNARIDSVYFGGGSPSQLPMKDAETLINALKHHFNLSPEVEISFEGEARSLSQPGYLEMLRESGVHRTSFGVQSFDPNVRKLANLFPNLQIIHDLADRVRSLNFGLNVDIMLGLPAQTPRVYQDDLRQAVEGLGADHVDLYENILFPNTVHFEHRNEYESIIMSDHDRWMMMRHTLDYLESHGFSQMTSEDFVRPGHEYKMKIINFGRRGKPSQVLALGPTAVGYMAGFSYRNTRLSGYLEPSDGLPVDRIHRATREETARRPYVFLGKLLYLDEVDCADPPPADIREKIDMHIEMGLVERVHDTQLRLTRLGREWIDAICYDYLLPEEKRRLFKIVQ